MTWPYRYLLMEMMNVKNRYEHQGRVFCHKTHWSKSSCFVIECVMSSVVGGKCLKKRWVELPAQDLLQCRRRDSYRKQES